MSTILNVPTISCDHCKMTIERALSELEGVSKAEVDIDRRQVEVDFDASQVSMEEIEEALDEVGYEVAK